MAHRLAGGRVVSIFSGSASPRSHPTEASRSSPRTRCRPRRHPHRERADPPNSRRHSRHQRCIRNTRRPPTPLLPPRGDSFPHRQSLTRGASSGPSRSPAPIRRSLDGLTASRLTRPMLSCRVSRCVGTIRLGQQAIVIGHRGKRVIRRRTIILEDLAHFSLAAGHSAKIRVALRALAGHELALRHRLVLLVTIRISAAKGIALG